MSVLPDDEWRRLRTTTWSMCVLIFLVAFEAFAVTTVMPTVSRALDGAALYAFAFAGPLATGVIGMVVAGTWCDRHGPRAPLALAVVFFAIGLVGRRPGADHGRPGARSPRAGRRRRRDDGRAVRHRRAALPRGAAPAGVRRLLGRLGAAGARRAAAAAGAVAQHGGLALGVPRRGRPGAAGVAGPPAGRPADRAAEHAGGARATRVGSRGRRSRPRPSSASTWPCTSACRGRSSSPPSPPRRRSSRSGRLVPDRQPARRPRAARRHRDPRPGRGRLPGRRGLPAVPAHRPVRLLADHRRPRPDVRRPGLGGDLVGAGPARRPADQPRRDRARHGAGGGRGQRASPSRRPPTSHRPQWRSRPGPSAVPAWGSSTFASHGPGAGLLDARQPGHAQLGPVHRGLDRRRARAGAHRPGVHVRAGVGRVTRPAVHGQPARGTRLRGGRARRRAACPTASGRRRTADAASASALRT